MADAMMFTSSVLASTLIVELEFVLILLFSKRAIVSILRVFNARENPNVPMNSLLSDCGPGLIKGPF